MMHTPVLWKHIFHISVPDIGYGMVECRGIRTGSGVFGLGLATIWGFCRRLSVITQRHTRAHTHTHTHARARARAQC